jgi:hypothetical protein
LKTKKDFTPQGTRNANRIPSSAPWGSAPEEQRGNAITTMQTKTKYWRVNSTEIEQKGNPLFEYSLYPLSPLETRACRCIQRSPLMLTMLCCRRERWLVSGGDSGHVLPLPLRRFFA